MERTIKLLALCSVVALTTTACAPSAYSPYDNNQTSTGSSSSTTPNYTGPTKNSVTHSHGGKVHSHPLPACGLNHTHAIGGGSTGGNYGGNYGGGSSGSYGGSSGGNYGGSWGQGNYNQNSYGPRPGNNDGGVTHSHCGRVHTHPLPPEGLGHTHPNTGCTAGGTSSGGGQQGSNYGTRPTGTGTNTRPPINNNNNTYRPPQPQPYQPPVNGGDTSYDGGAYDGAGNTGGTGGYFDYSGNTGGTGGQAQTNDSYYSYGGTGGNTGSGSSYYDQAQPKTPAPYYDNSGGGSSFDYYASTPNSSNSRPSNSGNTGSSTGSFAPSNYRGGNSYTVQKGDTVFQVMRNTGVYWKDIIRMNGLQAPNYQINPGQVLKLR